MKPGALASVALFFLGNAITAAAQKYKTQIRLAWPHPDVVSASVPNKPWMLEIGVPGFAVKSGSLLPDGRRYVLGENSNSGVTLSFFLEQVSPGPNSSDCHHYLQNWITANSGLQMKDVKWSQVGEVAVVEYMIPQLKGMPVQQKNVVGCLAREDVYADIHLSKADFKPEDESLFTSILEATHFKD